MVQIGAAMDHVYIADEGLLCFLCKEQAPSPEESLLSIEDALDSGELSLDEVRQLIADHNSRNRP